MRERSILPTTVVGSFSVPEWLERLKTDYYQRRISSAYLQEIHEVAIKAALKDQEQAGVEIVSDGELRRDNDLDYFLARMPGVEIPHLAKAYYYDYFDAYVRHPLPSHDATDSLGLVDDLRFTLTYTDRPVKFSLTGPYSLARRVRNEAYADQADLVMDLARILNREARALAAAGAAILQVDEPFLAGYPEHVDAGDPGRQHGLRGRRRGREAEAGAPRLLRQPLRPAGLGGPLRLPLPGRPGGARSISSCWSWPGKGDDDLELFRRYPSDHLALGLGVIDVKSTQVEPVEVVAARIRRGAGRAAARPAAGQPRLRAAAPAAGRRPRQAARHA